MISFDGWSSSAQEHIEKLPLWLKESSSDKHFWLRVRSFGLMCTNIFFILIRSCSDAWAVYFSLSKLYLKLLQYESKAEKIRKMSFFFYLISFFPFFLTWLKVRIFPDGNESHFSSVLSSTNADPLKGFSTLVNPSKGLFLVRSYSVYVFADYP